jgi:DNA polymerase-1
MEHEKQIEAYLKATKSHDYMDVPMDQMALYACWDIHGNRALYRYLQEHRPDGLKGIWDTEIKLTPVLYDMEMDGLRINPMECKARRVQCLDRMIEYGSRIQEIADREWTNSSACIKDILCEQFGLPVLATKKEKQDGREVDTGRASFDKKALALYSIHPQVTCDPTLVELVQLILKYRRESQHNGIYLTTFLELHDENNLVHPSYNQVVRTGRMSSRRPNSQQQNKRSKRLIHPHPGYGFISNDYSQIEYRLIVHYIQDAEAIAAYNANPKTDFHQWVADMIGVTRKAGKTLNFGMAYGAGKKKVTKELMANPDIMAVVGEEVNAMVERGDIQDTQRRFMFEELCRVRAAEVYQQYHEHIPGVKITARNAANAAKKRGFVFNAYGRRRYLPTKACYKAFNSIVQGCAMDLMKERMVELSPRYNQTSRDWGLSLAGNVHDEVFSQVPLEHLREPALHDYICTTLETPAIPFRVPIVTGLGISERNWAEAAGDDTTGEGDTIAGSLR